MRGLRGVEGDRGNAEELSVVGGAIAVRAIAAERTSPFMWNS